MTPGVTAATTAAAPAPRSRHIPHAVRRAVLERDGHCCTYTKASGRRCTATRFLELHHRLAFAPGGLHAVDNIEVRCRVHKQLAARQLARTVSPRHAGQHCIDPAQLVLHLLGVCHGGEIQRRAGRELGLGLSLGLSLGLVVRLRSGAGDARGAGATWPGTVPWNPDGAADGLCGAYIGELQCSAHGAPTSASELFHTFKEVHVKQQIALAYGIAGLTSAIAVVAVVGSMVGWSDTTPPDPTGTAVAAPVAWAPATSPADPVTAVEQREEVVYVDETGAPLLGPPRARYGDDDHDSDDDDDDDSEDDDSDRRWHRDDD